MAKRLFCEKPKRNKLAVTAEQAKARAMQQETDLRMAHYFKCAPGLFFTLRQEPDGRISMPFLTGQIASLHGLALEAPVEDIKPLLALCHPDDVAPLLAELQRSRREMASCCVELRIGDSAAEQLVMELKVLPHQDENCPGVMEWNGSMHDITGRIMTDITERKLAEQQLREALEFAEGVINAIPDILFEVDRNGKYLNVWTKNQDVLATPKEVLLGKTFHEMLSQENADVLMKAISETDEKGVSYGNTICIGQLNGESRWYEHSLAKKHGSMLSDDTFIMLSRDITERKRMEAALALREREFRTLVENSPDMVARYGRDFRRIYVNPAFTVLSEGGAAALLGTTPSECPGGPYAALYEQYMTEVFASGKDREFELRWTDKDGRELCSLVNLTPEFGKDGTVESILVVGRDITELHVFRQKIHQMAFYDPLTTLPNRALFHDRLQQMITDASWYSQLMGVVIIDMDRFKAVNDTMGHSVGDELLRETAARLSSCVRAYDTVARLGGDEFAILLPDIRLGADLDRIAGKILRMFDEPFLLAGKEIFVSCSIGIAVYPNDSTDAHDLLKYADSAMYFAKRSGRNNFRFYSKELTASAKERLTLESELRYAIERKELELYYQPKVLLQNGMMVGSEALLRWRHPQLGMVPPTQFIQIAEDTGLIIELGNWVLREACRTASEWNTEGKPLHKIAINLSARQFQSQDLPAVVAHILDETACRPEWIELEITESILLDEDGKTLDMLSAFRSMGVSIAIDDFGTGYSALSYLARFPIDTLKIDKSFIHSVVTDKYRAELVKAILSIAHCLKQEVVAEGVETAEQAAFLESNGCRIAQGFLYSKPLPKIELASLPQYFSRGNPPRAD